MLCIVICVDYILLAFLDFLFPREDIDLAPKFELSRWQEVIQRVYAPRCRQLTVLLPDVRGRGGADRVKSALVGAIARG